jgi:hypothetical protein
MTCIANQRAVLVGAVEESAARTNSGAGAGNGGADVNYGGPRFESQARNALAADLVQQAKDLMVFAGLMRLRLGKGVWEGIVNGAGEVGVY